MDSTESKEFWLCQTAVLLTECPAYVSTRTVAHTGINPAGCLWVWWCHFSQHWGFRATRRPKLAYLLCSGIQLLKP